MNKTFLLLTFISFISCHKERNYKYIENIKELNSNSRIIHRKEYNIPAKNDTLAYIKAYKKYSVSKRMMYQLNKGGSTNPKDITHFQLFNRRGINITNINFTTKKEEEKKADEYAEKIEISYKIDTK